MVYVSKSDLGIILDHILIAEQHAAGTPLTDLVPDPLLPFGLRLVDGTLNNLTPGRETNGSADQTMPRLLDSTFLTSAQTGDVSIFNAETNLRTGQPTSYAQTSGSVYDSQPRVISNLVADQTLRNPAAIAAALKHSGLVGQELLNAINLLSDAHTALLEANALAGNVEGALAAQRALAVNELDAAAGEVAAAQAEVAARTSAKSDADAAYASAEQAVVSATDAFLTMQNASAVGAAMLALQAAQADLATAQAALASAEQALAAATATRDALVEARDAKQTEVDGLVVAKSEADTALASAQTALAAAQSALAAETNSAEAVTTAQGVVATAEADLALADTAASAAAGALATAEAELSSLDAELASANEAVAAAEARVTAAQTAATSSQAALDAALADQEAASVAEASAYTTFLSAFNAWTADFLNTTARAEYFAAAVEWGNARGALSDANLARSSAEAADTNADQEVIDAGAALSLAQAAAADLVARRGAAIAARDQRQTEKNIADQALLEAQTALTTAQDGLAAAEASNAAYVAAAAAVDAAQAEADAAATAATAAADALTAAEAELVQAESAVATAEADLTPLGASATAAGEAVAAEQSAVAQAESAYAAAQAIDQQSLATAALAVENAVAEAMAAQAIAAQAATDLVTAETAEATAQASLEAATAALAALDAPGAAEAAQAAAATSAADAQLALNTALTTYAIEMDGDNVRLPDVAPDEGLTAPYNSWMSLFGQFFDHGLDLVSKGGSGTVYIPLQPDDPLYVEGSPTNFMVLTRATNQPGPDGILGTADDIREHSNKTTPWVDQNQTYTSHPSHQVFLRDYTLEGGVPVATGDLLHGVTGGMSTWGDVKAQAESILGIRLNDTDVTDGPLLATDPYGNFIPGPNGLPQLVVANPDFGVVEGAPEHILVEGDLANPVDASIAVRNGHAFLEDIAHNAAPGSYVVDRFTGETAMKTADPDAEVGNEIIPNAFGQNETYDNELLDRHFIAGDGRANENFGLTAVHHVFHSEHNRQVTEMKETILGSGDLAFINAWLRTPITEADLGTVSVANLSWNGERLFQAAKFTTEMQYQHLAFEEFGRKIQPQIAAFVANASLEVDGSIMAEFAHVVYRFGHSMLTENVQSLSFDMQDQSMDLISAFLNPVAFDADQTLTPEQAAGAVIRGMTRETGSNIDEFLTSALRDNLVGLPLDLAALNIARGRETGVPSLNAAREAFYAATGSEFLKPYENWGEFAANLKTPASVVNFIAAYGTHDTIVNAVTVEDKRAAATALVLGGENAPADRLDFVLGTGAWAGVGSGIDDVEFWIGGLAEAIMPFGGMLGSTFGFVFQYQLEALQNADRFYYLSRTAGMNMLAELENNSFSSMMIRNSDISDGGSHIGAEAFAAMEYILEVNQAYQLGADPVSTEVDPFLAAMGTQKVERATATVDAPLVEGSLTYDNLLKFNGGEHVVLGGTNDRDILVGGLGDDALWGDGGDDLLIGGAGVNTLRGGAGNDILKDGDDISFLHGEDGDDVISAGGGAGELIFGGAGNDAILMGADDAKESFGGLGDDFITGGSGSEIMFGGEGDDWIEGGDGFDILMGDNGDPFGGSPVMGHDVLFGGPNDNDLLGESGDDILFQGEGVHVNDAELGYDWIAHKGGTVGADVDLTRALETFDQAGAIRDRYINAEAASGWDNDDLLYGDNRIGAALPADVVDPLVNAATLFANELTQEGVNRIEGLREFLADLMGVAPDDTFTGGNILLGGGGSDVIQGRGGNDVIDGDKWLNARISIRDTNNPTLELRSVDSLNEIIPELLDGSISASQLQIVREIVDGGREGDVDVAVYYDVRANYNITANADGSWTVSHVNVTPGPNPIDPNNGNPNPIGGDGTDRLTNIEVLRFADMEINLSEAAGQVIVGDENANVLTGFTGPDAIFAGGGADTIDGGVGDDVIFGEGGNDTIVWTAGGGMDLVDGGIGGVDTFVVNGDATDEDFRIYTAAAWTGEALSPGVEIAVTRQVAGGAETLIAQLSNIEEIIVNTGAGTNSVTPVGDFTATSLNFNTITVDGEEGDDKVDISGLLSAHRIVLRADGGNDMIIGRVREQDVILLPEGTDLAALQRSDADGVVTLTDGARSVRFTAEAGVEPGLVVAGTPTAAALIEAGTVDENTGEFRLPNGLIALSQTDLDALKYMVSDNAPAPVLPLDPGDQPETDDNADGNADNGLITGVRDLPGLENNEVHPGYGAATEPFIRVTDARYGPINSEIGNRDINPIFAGLDPRDISNELGAQEPGTPTEAEANMFLMSFGQYFDHGLTFIPKSSANGVIEIGGAGSGREPGTDNPADLTRATVVGFDGEGIPQHENITSPFVDQNQVYGSSSLIGQLLRESDTEGGVGAQVLLGQADPSNPDFRLLATLRELLDHHIDAGTVFTGTHMGDVTLLEYYPGLRDAGVYDAAIVKQLSEDFMGEGWPILIDTNPFMNLLDHFVGGDGRANENVGLTAMHTIWARNHNHHVETLIESGFEGTPEEIFQAAKILNEAEYQQVVFNDFADALIGGLRGSGRHGHDKYNPEADARISHEFAGAVYRLGHSMIGQTLTILDENGVARDIPLFDVFLNPTNDASAFAFDPDGSGPAPALEGQNAVDALLEYNYTPQPGYAQYGVNSILGGLAEQPSEMIDFNIVDAVRNDLVRVNADLFSFNVARGWDLGIGTLNQVKMSLAASTDPYVSEAIELSDMAMVPYASWEDFQARNGLSNTVIEQFKAAYPDLKLAAEDVAAFREANPDINLIANEDGTMTVKGIDRVDLWVGGLAEARINDGLVGHTFWVVMHEQLDRLQEGDRFYYTDRVGNLPVYNNFIANLTFGDIVERNTGLTGLPQKIFDYTSGTVDDAAATSVSVASNQPLTEVDTMEQTEIETIETAQPGATVEEVETVPSTMADDTTETEMEPILDDAETNVSDDQSASSMSEEQDTEPSGNPEVTASDDSTSSASASGETEEDNTEDTEAEGEDDTSDEEAETVVLAAPNPRLLNGSDMTDALEGGAGDDNLFGIGGDDALIGGAGNDVIDGGAGNDLLNGQSGDDVIFGGDGNDNILGDAGADMLFGDEGDDRILAGDGADLIDAGVGDDVVYAGSGDDTIVTTQGDGDDLYFGGDGTDTLDMSSIVEDVFVHLGAGQSGKGYAIQENGSRDSFSDFENIMTGSGDDVIVANDQVNTIDGGDGNDTFVFESVASVAGDQIVGFQPGDRIDLSQIDSVSAMAGQQSFVLVGSDGFDGAGQLLVTHETIDDEVVTVVAGNTSGGEAADFRLTLKGHHDLTSDNFVL